MEEVICNNECEDCEYYVEGCDADVCSCCPGVPGCEPRQICSRAELRE